MEFRRRKPVASRNLQGLDKTAVGTVTGGCFAGVKSCRGRSWLGLRYGAARRNRKLELLFCLSLFSWCPEASDKSLEMRSCRVCSHWPPSGRGERDSQNGLLEQGYTNCC